MVKKLKEHNEHKTLMNSKNHIFVLQCVDTKFKFFYPLKLKLHLFLSHRAALSPKKGVKVFRSFSGFEIRFFSRYDLQPHQFLGAEISKPLNILKN
jgi:hypothetical protein